MKTLTIQPHFNPFFILLPLLITSSSSSSSAIPIQSDSQIQRRILHQPLFPANSAPPPELDSSPPPPSQDFPNPDQPFFPEVPAGPKPDQSQPPPATAANGTIPIPAATQPEKPAKKVAIGISVGIVTLGMLSGLAFFLYRHRVKHPGDSQKLVGGDFQRFADESVPPSSSVLYMGTVQPSRVSGEVNGTIAEANSSPYRKLNSIKRSDRYRPSPELQPLPPLPRAPSQRENDNHHSPSSNSVSSSDEESHGTAFYTPQGSTISAEDGYYTPAGVPGLRPVSNGSWSRSSNGQSVPHSKRTSPRSRLSSVSSPEMKHVIIPSIKQPRPSPSAPQPPPPPPFQAPAQQNRAENIEQTSSYFAKRTKFAAPPPPPNMALLRSINNQQSSKMRTPPRAPPPAPPPPPLPPLATQRPGKTGSSGNAKNSVSSTPTKQLEAATPSPKGISKIETVRSIEGSNGGVNSSEKTDAEEQEGGKAKLKPLHWDKVRATSDRATVWDQLRSSSFQLNEVAMESLFSYNSTNSVPKEPIRRSVLPPLEPENRVLDPKKSQNIAILLRALNVTKDEVSEALFDGNPESLGADLLETLVKMAPTKEEEIKLREYSGDASKLGSAERFLKAVLDIPFAFRRVEAMLYRASFDTEIKYLRKSFQTLEVASDELKNSRLFLKLLEAVLRTGNRMNVGTNRGDARSFKLDTLLKLVDIKGTDGKTTLLHFVVQEIIRSEGPNTDSTIGNPQVNTPKFKEDDFRKQGLQVVSGLSRDLSNVKKAAGMDSDVLSSYVSKLEVGLQKVRSVLQYEKPDTEGKFFHSMKLFLREADEEISRIKADEKKALSLVKEVTEYFHGDTAKEEAHPFRIFMIVRDFLNVLDHVCKEVGNMQDKTMVGAARSFRISASASLPVLNRYNVRQDSSSDDDSCSSP